jgi:hypothetical protein
MTRDALHFPRLPGVSEPQLPVNTWATLAGAYRPPSRVLHLVTSARPSVACIGSLPAGLAPGPTGPIAIFTRRHTVCQACVTWYVLQSRQVDAWHHTAEPTPR